MFEHLQQSPALSAITFRVQNSFALEVHIIDQCVGALSRTPHAFELLLHVRAIFRSGFVKHLWQCVLQPVDQELRLKIDSPREKTAQVSHLRRILSAFKLSP